MWPHLMWFPGPTRLSNPNCMLISTAVFAQLMAEGPYTLQWTDISHSKLPFSWASGPHLIHDSLCSPESTSQTASQEFRFGPALRQWQTDQPRYSICSNRLHLASAVMRTKNSLQRLSGYRLPLTDDALHSMPRISPKERPSRNAVHTLTQLTGLNVSQLVKMSWRSATNSSTLW